MNATSASRSWVTQQIGKVVGEIEATREEFEPAAETLGKVCAMEEQAKITFGESLEWRTKLEFKGRHSWQQTLEVKKVKLGK